MIPLLLLLAVGVGQQAHQKDCPKGQYMSMDGRCLKDHTGEARPSGDGCNTMTCTDPSCRYGVSTAMACSHPDDPASSWSTSNGVLRVPTSVSVTVLPPDSVRSYASTKDANCDVGYSKQWTTVAGYDTDYRCVEQISDQSQPAPLKCGKYEHVEHTFTACSIKNCDSKSGTCEMDCPPSDRCEPTMHPLKESEYQEIMDRLKKLESRTETK